MTEEHQRRWAPPEGEGAGPPAGGVQPPPPRWSAPAAPPGAFGTSLPSYPEPARGRRGPAFVGIAVGAVLAVAAAAFAVTSLGADGGSSTPEAAVEAMFAAVEDQDVLGILDTLAPGEREVYLPFVEEMVGELQRLDVLSGELDLGAIDGIEIDVEGLELRSSSLGPGVSVVSITGGTITSTLDPSEVPVGSFVRGLMDDPGSGFEIEPVTSTEPLAPDEPFDIVVVDDGGWHVSLHYSIAELARESSGLPAPAFGQGVQPDGAASPEAALEELLQAAVDLDLRRVIALTPPGEMSALHDYAPLFLGEAEAAVAELRAESAFDISIDRLDTEADRDGGTAKVTVAGFAASGVIDGEAFEAAYEGECFRATFEGETEEICLDELEEQGMTGSFSRSLVDAQLGVMTVERDGEWYVSPTRSVLEVVLALVGAVDREDLEDPEQFFSDAFGFGLTPFLYGSPFATGMEESFGTVDDQYSFEEDGVGPGGGFESYDDPYAECNAIYEDLPVGATDEEYAEAGAAYDECFARVDGARSSKTTSGATPGEAPPGAECEAVYEQLPADATDEQWAAADEAYGACYEAATGG